MVNIWCCTTHHTRHFNGIFISSMIVERHSWAKSLINLFWLLGLMYVILYFFFDFEFIHAFSVGLCLLVRFTIWTKFESYSLSRLKSCRASVLGISSSITIIFLFSSIFYRSIGQPVLLAYRTGPNL